MSESRSFAGETPELGAVVDRGVTMEQFQDKLKLYVFKNYKKGEDVVTLVTDLLDPRTDFESKHAPTDFSPEEEKLTGLVKKWEIKFKKYLDRKEELQENTSKLYALIMGQYTIAMMSVIKGDPDFDGKSKAFDALWLFNKVKTISAGVDSKANPVFSLHEQLFFFLTMRQGQNESDDDYLARFNSKAKNLEMAGGDHILQTSSEKLLHSSIKFVSSVWIILSMISLCSYRIFSVLT